MVCELDLNKAVIKKKSKPTQKNLKIFKFRINLTENTPRSSLYSDSPLYTEWDGYFHPTSEIKLEKVYCQPRVSSKTF